LRDYVSTGIELNLGVDFRSSIIVLVKRRNWEDLQCMGTLVPISPSVEIDLKLKIRKWQQTTKIQLYESLACVEVPRSMASPVFELLAQSRLERRIALDMVPVQKQSLGLGKEPPWWESTHEDQSASQTAGASDMEWEDEESVSIDQVSTGPEEAHSSVTVGFQRRAVVEYEEPSTIRKIHEGTLYIPTLTNQVVSHPFIAFDGFLQVFEFSNASHYAIKQCTVSFFSWNPLLDRLPPKKKWRFVLVVPRGNSISFRKPRNPELAEFLNEVKLFSAQLDPSERTR
jgi:hypothetical protein